MDTRLLEEELDLESGDRSRGEMYRLRRPHASRRRSRGTSQQKKSSAPGSIRQRRNKHWNW